MQDGTQPNVVAQAFADETRLVAIADLVPLRPITDAMRRTRKYFQITASVREIGLVEPISGSKLLWKRSTASSQLNFAAPQQGISRVNFRS